MMNPSTKNPVTIGPYLCGQGQPLMVIAGPCVLESAELTMQIAGRLQEIGEELKLNIVFKASFDKANRTSLAAQRGVGIEAGVEILAEVNRATGLPVTTDIHEPWQAEKAARACDLLQIPAFLARQTDLLVAAAETGKAVNVKKGQFMAPADMQFVLEKLNESGCQDVLLCERGTFFGYGRLVNDMPALLAMRQLGPPVVFDATHSVQQPGGLGGKTGGNRTLVEPLARAAIAVGVDALFFETHPQPETSPSDGPNMVPLNDFAPLLRRILHLRGAMETLPN